MITTRKAEPVTMGHIRGHGVTRLLIYCGACSHSTVIDGASLPNDLVPRSLGPRMVCKACGHVGADVRPDWSQRGDLPALMGLASRATRPPMPALHSTSAWPIL